MKLKNTKSPTEGSDGSKKLCFWAICD